MRTAIGSQVIVPDLPCWPQAIPLAVKRLNNLRCPGPPVAATLARSRRLSARASPLCNVWAISEHRGRRPRKLRDPAQHAAFRERQAQADGKIHGGRPLGFIQREDGRGVQVTQGLHALRIAAGPPGGKLPLELLTVPIGQRIVGRQAATHQQEFQQQHVAPVAVGIGRDGTIARAGSGGEVRRAVAFRAVGASLGHGDGPVRSGRRREKGVEVDQVQRRIVRLGVQIDDHVVRRQVAMHEFRPFEHGQGQEQVPDATPAEVFGKSRLPPPAMPLLRSSQVSPGTAFAR